MSIASVSFDVRQWRNDLRGLMKGHIRSPAPGIPAVNLTEKTVWVHLGLRMWLHLFEEDIEQANVEAWECGVTWAKKYYRAGYGANEKPWGDVPEEKRIT